jgi:hypothetical protein
MALRRPAAPRVRPDRPGAPVAPAVAAPPAAPVATAATPAPSTRVHPVAPASSEPPAASVAAPPPAAAPPAPAAPELPPAVPELPPTPQAAARRPLPRRTLLLAGGAAAAVAGIAAAGVLAARTLGPATSPFSDVADGDAALEAMIWADDTGILPASGDAFSPDAAVTRGEVAAALHRFAGTPAVPLEDVPVLIVDLGEDAAQASALLWLHGRGALWGDAELKVHPEDPATRTCATEMLAALLRPALAGVGAVWTSETEAEADASLPLDAAWLTRAGMVPQLDGDWDGEAGVTRAELATVLHRADGVIAAALESLA